jgi:curli biogenesis system outer membrane secretion channel CsgG
MITEDSLARLAIAWEACQLAESARTAVTVQGDLVAQANEVLAAAERYAAAVHAFTCRQETGARVNWQLPEAPEEAAEDLDDWVLRHADGEDPGTAPISGKL